jgi:pyruvate dehydrogenase E2 component (dihydrolipoamide acetyltransferase)
VAEPQPPGLKGAITRLEPQRWQVAVARRSAEARATIPHLELELDADASALGASQGAQRTARLARACALALREHPLANGAWRDGAPELHARVNIGVLLALEERHVAPTLLDADARPAAELAEELEELGRAARAGTLRAPQLAGATFTLWDLAPLGITRAAPLVVPGQAAALAAGSTRELALVRDGAIVRGQTMTLTLASDHRILYGAAAAAFLTRVGTLVEEGVT